jgi:hypothetical protein
MASIPISGLSTTRTSGASISLRVMGAEGTIMPKTLTPKQRTLIAEIEAIASIVHMDHWNILSYSRESRTTCLELIKNKLVRSEVIFKFALIDELLSVIVCHHYFRKPQKAATFRQLWKTKEFRIFNHHILDEIYLLPKMRLVHAIRSLPPHVRNNIERINALRNALAHNFFPENLRQYKDHKKVIYRGVDIYTKQGLERFDEDFKLVSEFLVERAFRLR